MSKLIGLCFDGCSTMADRKTGVKARIRGRHHFTVYFHCVSHRLNLLVNDFNNVLKIRDTVGTIIEVIKFFRKSLLRKKIIPSIPML